MTSTPSSPTLCGAFAADPLWRWAFADMAGLEKLWRLLVTSAMRRYGSVREPAIG